MEQEEADKLVTYKASGYGLKNVKNSAETCGGFCVIQHENDIYSVTVIVPMSS